MKENSEIESMYESQEARTDLYLLSPAEASTIIEALSILEKSKRRSRKSEIAGDIKRYFIVNSLQSFSTTIN